MFANLFQTSISLSPGDKNTFVSSPRTIMITPANKVDKQFDSKMDKVRVRYKVQLLLCINVCIYMFGAVSNER